MAIECYEQLGLDEVRFIPLYSPPHRQQPFATAKQRLTMLELAIKNINGFVIDECELQRQEISYTIDTVKFIREKTGNTSLCLLLGTDAFNTLNTWRDWQSLLDFVHIIIAERPDTRKQTQNPELIRYLEEYKTNQIDTLNKQSAGKIIKIEIPILDISATRIRDIFRNRGNPAYLLPDNVINYIYSNNIYQTD